MIELGETIVKACGYAILTENISVNTGEMELLIVLQGTGIYKIEKASQLMTKGDILVVESGRRYHYEQDRNLVIGRIVFSLRQLQYVLPEVKGLPSYQKLFEKAVCPINEEHVRWISIHSLGSFEHISSMVTYMIQEYKDKSQGWEVATDTAFLHLVSHLSRIEQPRLVEEHTKVAPIIKSVSYMETHFKEPLTLREIAEKSHVSIRHFSRMFREMYHVSPGQHIILMRLEYACQLLRADKGSISEIAVQSGFNDSNYFCRQFQKNIRMTPKAYRLQYTSMKR